MEIRAITDAAELDALVATQPLQPFLQAWAWGEFQRALGRTIWRLGAYDGLRLVGAATLIQHDLQLNVRYVYCPRGPITQTPEAMSPLVAAAVPAVTVFPAAIAAAAMSVGHLVGLFSPKKIAASRQYAIASVRRGRASP